MALNLPAQITRNQFTADGILDTFAYTFKIFEEDNLDVFVTLFTNTPDPIADLKILNTDYIVTNVGNVSGGTVVFQPGKIPPDLSTITIVRAIPASQTSEFSDPQTFNGENLDDSLEREVALIQQNITALDFNSIKYAINEILANNTESVVPTLGENQIWKKESGKIVAATLTANDGTLRSDLANETAGAEGSLLVGHNNILSQQTTVKATLDSLENTQINAKTSDFYIATGTADTIILTPSVANTNPLKTSYIIGDTISFIPILKNNGVVTVDVNSLGSKSILSSDGVPLISNEINPSFPIKAIYNGTDFIISNKELNIFGDLTTSVGYTTIVGESIVQFNTVRLNERNFFDISIFQYSPLINALYLVECQMGFGGGSTSGDLDLLLKNVSGTELSKVRMPIGANVMAASSLITLDGSQDNNNRVRISVNSTVSGEIFSPQDCYFRATLIKRL